jgi:hypothetical protein
LPAASGPNKAEKDAGAEKFTLEDFLAGDLDDIAEGNDNETVEATSEPQRPVEDEPVRCA